MRFLERVREGREIILIPITWKFALFSPLIAYSIRINHEGSGIEWRNDLSKFSLFPRYQSQCSYACFYFFFSFFYKWTRLNVPYRARVYVFARVCVSIVRPENYKMKLGNLWEPFPPLSWPIIDRYSLVQDSFFLSFYSLEKKKKGKEKKTRNPAGSTRSWIDSGRFHWGELELHPQKGCRIES